MKFTHSIEKEFSAERICRERKSQKVVASKSLDCIFLDGETNFKGDICDCIAFCETKDIIFIALLELKTATLDVSEIVRQLRSCHRKMIQILHNRNRENKKVVWRAAVVSDGGRDRAVMDKLRKDGYRIDGMPIKTLKYGEPDSLKKLFAYKPKRRKK